MNDHVRHWVRRAYGPIVGWSVLWMIVLTLAAKPALGADHVARDSAELRAIVRRLRAGDRLNLAPGRFAGGVYVEALRGEPERPIVIAGAVGSTKTEFIGGAVAFHFKRCQYVTLRDVRVAGCVANGVNVDDGGQGNGPSVGMEFERLVIEDIGPTGNRDALKLSGLSRFRVSDCDFRGWGGSAIDMVGCHDGVVERCRFVGKKGYSQDNAVQTKGGSERIRVVENFFHRAGQRGVNIGGSTGKPYFRPKLTPYEAKDILVEGNYFLGSLAPVVFATAVDCRARRNTIVHPEKWVARILQEQPIDEFLPCQNGLFEANLVVLDRRLAEVVNVGPNTRPTTFRFQGNAWFHRSDDRRPNLPSRETNGIYQIDPRLVDEETPQARVTSTDARLANIGAPALPVRAGDSKKPSAPDVNAR